MLDSNVVRPRSRPEPEALAADRGVRKTKHRRLAADSPQLIGLLSAGLIDNRASIRGYVAPIDLSGHPVLPLPAEVELPFDD